MSSLHVFMCPLYMFLQKKSITKLNYLDSTKFFVFLCDELFLYESLCKKTSYEDGSLHNLFLPSIKAFDVFLLYGPYIKNELHISLNQYLYVLAIDSISTIFVFSNSSIIFINSSLACPTALLSLNLYFFCYITYAIFNLVSELIQYSIFVLPKFQKVSLTYKSWKKEIINSFIPNQITQQRLTNDLLKKKISLLRLLKELNLIIRILILLETEFLISTKLLNNSYI